MHEPIGYVANENRYESMAYSRCGRSGLLLPQLSLGLWRNFGAPDAYDRARAILLRAFDRGITHFDVANNYGPPYGAAERTLGRVFGDDLRPYRDEIIVSTKAGWDMWAGPYGNWGSRKHLLASLDQSLHRLGLDYVDIFYHHRPDPDTPLEESMDALAGAVRQGKALYAGISAYGVQGTMEAINLLKAMRTRCLVHQPRYSMLDREIERGLLDRLQEAGVGCIVFCAMERGLLTEKYIDGIPAESRLAKPWGGLDTRHLTKSYRRMLKRLDELARTRGQSLAQMALAWTLRSERVNSALIGVSSIDQLEQNIAALDNRRFSHEELAAIDRIIAEGGCQAPPGRNSQPRLVAGDRP